METPLSNLWLVAILPLVSIVCLGLNFLIRARGGRSVVINLKAFGIELNINSVVSNHPEDPPVVGSVVATQSIEKVTHNE